MDDWILLNSVVLLRYRGGSSRFFCLASSASYLWFFSSRELEFTTDSCCRVQVPTCGLCGARIFDRRAHKRTLFAPAVNSHQAGHSLNLLSPEKMASCTCVPASFRAFVVTCPTRCRLLVSSFRKSLPAVFSSSVSPTEQKSEVLGESRSPSTRVREPCRTWTVSSLSSASQFLRGPSPVQEVRRGFGTGAYWALNKERLYDETKLDEWREGFPNLHKYNNEGESDWGVAW